jgi:hypothetical protein
MILLGTMHLTVCGNLRNGYKTTIQVENARALHYSQNCLRLNLFSTCLHSLARYYFLVTSETADMANGCQNMQMLDSFRNV